MNTYKRNMFGNVARSLLYSHYLHHLNYKEINSTVRYHTVYFAVPIMNSLQTHETMLPMFSLVIK